MALRRGSSRLSLSRGPRRKTAWGVGPGSSAVASITVTSSQILGAGAASTLEGSTVVRIRGFFRLYLNLATAAGDGFNGAVGIGIAQNTAFVAGAAALPMPVAEVDDENWLFHQFFSCTSPVAFAAASSPGGEILPAFVDIPVDSKAMRKFDSDRILYAAIDVAETGTAGLEVFMDSRVLVKLA